MFEVLFFPLGFEFEDFFYQRYAGYLEVEVETQSGILLRLADTFNQVSPLFNQIVDNCVVVDRMAYGIYLLLDKFLQFFAFLARVELYYSTD